MDTIAITVCIDYADYLAQTLPNNRPLFSKYYIITERRDTETVRIASMYDCTLLYTNVTKTNGASFNKSGILYHTQRLLHKHHPTSWIVILDADIYLPLDIWKSIDISGLNKNGIYGISRKNYTTYSDYVSNSPSSVDTSENSAVGYFQMYWNKTKYYESWSINCAKSDLNFMKLFRYIIGYKDIYCFHFGEKHTNWNGRVCKAWEPAPAAPAAPEST